MIPKYDLEHFRVESKEYYGYNTNETNTRFRVVQMYENNSPEPITVVLRNNLPITVETSEKHFTKDCGLTIRTCYHFNGKDMIVSTINHLSEIMKDRKVNNPDMDIIHNTLLEAYNKANGVINFQSVTIDRFVPYKKICQHTGIYVHEADLLICNPKRLKYMQHPHSEEGMLIESYQRITEKNNISGVFIELIDNDNKISTRYMYLAKRLIEISPRVDKSRRSGVYYTTTGFDFTGEPEIQPEFHTFEEAEQELGLHKTEEEAKSGGDPETLNRVTENRTKVELLELKRETELERIAFDREKARSDEKLRAMQAELDEAKILRNDFYEDRKFRRADQYDHRHASRKDSSETLKLAAAAIGGALAVFGLVNGRKK